MGEQTGTDQEQQRTAYCTWHSSVETRLSCSQCGRNICTECLVQASVGIRCPECGKATKMPTFDVQPALYAKASVVGGAVVIGGGILWALFNFIFINLGFSILTSAALPALLIGYGTGELINVAVNAKRSKGLAYIAAGSVIGAFILAQIIYSGRIEFFGLIVMAVAVYTAVQRVK